MAETCPKCGYADVPGDECPRCRVIVSKYRAHLQSLGTGGVATLVAAPAPSAPPSQWRPSPAGGAPGGIRRLSFHGSGGSLFGIHIVNVLLTLITLGIYYFWGKVRVRSYLLSQSEFEGDRFSYHGTGKELLIGWLKAMLVFGIPVGLLANLPEFLDAAFEVKVAAGVLAYCIVTVFVPVAMVGARRYRLSRTAWRGIRFSFRGRVWNFVKLFVGGTLLSLVTLGLYAPFFATKRQGFMVSHSYFGNQKFDFDGRGRDLFSPFLVAILLTLPTLGLCWIWFAARKRRYFWDHTSVRAARFHSTVTGGALLGLYVVNLLLLIVTLGLAWPWVKCRNVRFTFRYLTLEGPLDMAGIQQEAQVAVAATGEGLASFLDMDFDLG